MARSALRDVGRVLELPIQEVKEGATKFLEELAALEAKIRAWK